MELIELVIGDGLTFLSIGYLFFLLAAALVRYLCPRSERAGVLLLLCWLFYCTWNPVCLLFLLASTISTWIAGLYVGQRRSLPHRKSALILCLILNLGLLFWCRYWSMFFPGFEDRLLPVGISFYTLQALGYVIDCYRYGMEAERAAQTVVSAGAAGSQPAQPHQGSDAADGSSSGSPQGSGSADDSPRGSRHSAGYAPETRFVNYALFVSFFPGLLSGPIERGHRMFPQFDAPCDFSYDNLRSGLAILLWGYFLKMVIADRIAIVVDTVYTGPEQWGSAVVLLAVLLYSLQIYCDFAGYSAIAVGSARVLGFRLVNNFEAPYLSGSIAEFWRRWHISLSSWFRDYLYIPLGGSRRGKGRRCLNILIVFTASGLWHGAGITFVVWGLLHGLYQVIGLALQPACDGAVRLLHINRNTASHRFLRTLWTFLLVSFAWIFFRAESLPQALRILQCLPGIRLAVTAAVSGTGAAMGILRSGIGFQPWRLFDGTLLSLGLDTMNWVLLAASLAFLFVRDLCLYHGISLREQIQRQGRWLRWTLYIAAILLILVCGIWGPDYDAATFIYSQF